MRDFYFTSSDRYELLDTQIGDTTLNVYAPAEADEQHELALRYAADAFESFSERFGPYPFTELDVVGIPPLPGAGGVEYPGIVVVVVPEDPQSTFFEGATAHEVAHQWFYSVVGNDQIDEPWLDESLAQYATLLYYLDVYGEAGYNGAREGAVQGRWEQIEFADIPIGQPVAAYDWPGIQRHHLWPRRVVLRRTPGCDGARDLRHVPERLLRDIQIRHRRHGIVQGPGRAALRV